MDKETKQIRQEEVEYHQQFYQEHELFEEGTWLEEPIPSVMDAFQLIRPKTKFTHTGFRVWSRPA